MRPAALAGLLSAGIPLQRALQELGQPELPKNLELAVRVGAPLVPTLELLERQLQADDKIRSELNQAQAIPRATRSLLLWLPVFTVFLTQLMGLNTLLGLFQPLGLVSLIFALGFLYLGARISKRMLEKLSQTPKDLTGELLALDVCLSAGLGLGQIQSETKIGPEARKLISLSQSTGASLRPLIDSEIERLNLQALDQRLENAKKLSVSLLIPLSMTTLPAFLLLTIPPMLIGITK